MRDWVILTSLLWRHIALLPAMPSIGSLCGKRAEHVKRKVREALVIHQLNRKDQMMNADRGMSLSKLWLDLV